MEFRFRAKSGNKTFDEPSYTYIYVLQLSEGRIYDDFCSALAYYNIQTIESPQRWCLPSCLVIVLCRTLWLNPTHLLSLQVGKLGELLTPPPTKRHTCAVKFEKFTQRPWWNACFFPRNNKHKSFGFAGLILESHNLQLTAPIPWTFGGIDRRWVVTILETGVLYILFSII